MKKKARLEIKGNPENRVGVGSAGYCAFISQGPHLAARLWTLAAFSGWRDRRWGNSSTANAVVSHIDLEIQTY